MKRFLIWFFTILGLIALSLLVWFVGPLIGLTGIASRSMIIGAIWFVAFLVWFIRWWLRRRAARKLEAEVAAVGDDTPILREKMQDALATLKKTSDRSGSAFLYDLPWYIIIGPPGSGKTTALVNSGLKFPLAGAGGAQAVAGTGGTRHCDWWFTEEAVLIDTAGRYTTQDSDASADSKSWEGFLDMLSQNRPRQPINGVIVAISIEDLMTLNPGELDQHASAIRRRLDELHKKLSIAFPVYVMLTKMDLVAGFMEFFGDLTPDQRAIVWGTTFQPKNKTDNMVAQFGAEFDQLMTALAEQTTDRLQQEPDPRARSRIFAFPTQMASLKNQINEFLTKVFEPSRYQADAALRGIYFTSGTQEGTPIDRVLGALSRNFGAQGGGAPAYSGQGRSFFLTNLMQRVIFEESGWVSTNVRHLRRKFAIKTAAYSLLALTALALVGAWVWSYMENSKLIDRTELAVDEYRTLAANQLNEARVGDGDIHTVLAPLNKLRTMPMGYTSDPDDAPMTEGLGLGQHERLHAANVAAYRDGLERMFLPRLIWQIEDMLNKNIDNEDFLYEALKVYLMLGGQETMQADFVRTWLKRDWEIRYKGASNAKGRELLLAHLDVILDRPSSAVPLNGPLVAEAQQVLARMPLANRVYTMLKTRAETASYPPWIASERAGNDATVVFETRDGAPLSDVKIPGFFTKDGFIQGFLDQIEAVIEEVKEEKWVLGEAGKQATFEAQYKTLREDVMTRYRAEFIRHWDEQLSRIKIAPVGSGSDLTVMSALAAPTSPLKQLLTSIRKETELTKLPEEGEEGGGGAAAGEGAAKKEAGKALKKVAKGPAGRIGKAMVGGALNNAKRGEEEAAPNYGERIEAHFKSLHEFAGEAEGGAAPVDALVARFNNLYQAMNDMKAGGSVRDQAISRIESEVRALKTEAPRMPGIIANMVEGPVKTIGDAALGSAKSQLNQTLANEVTAKCLEITRGKYPFNPGSPNDVNFGAFQQLFGPGGIMDGFFQQKLAGMVDKSGGNWRWIGDTEMSRTLSNATLREFQRAEEIRDAFFASGGFGVKFDIRPVTLSPDALSVTFQADGQELVYAHGRPASAPMQWPGPAGGQVVVSVTPEIPGQTNRISSVGPWALIRMMRKNAGLASGSTMSVDFSVGGRSASFEVTAHATKNPFKLPALNEFSCPRGL